MDSLPFSGVDLAITLWVLGATLLVVFMVRRGHDPVRWTIVAYLLGPVAHLVAAVARRRSSKLRPALLSPGTIASGTLAVLVGIDGSRESIAALDGTIATFGRQIGRLTLASVVSFEAARPTSKHPDRLLADRRLADAALRVEKALGFSPRTVVLPGAPAAALVDLALESGDDVIVVGRHGNGEADWILGSVAAELVEQSRVRAIVMGETLAEPSRPATPSEPPPTELRATN